MGVLSCRGFLPPDGCERWRYPVGVGVPYPLGAPTSNCGCSWWKASSEFFQRHPTAMPVVNWCGRGGQYSTSLRFQFKNKPCRSPFCKPSPIASRTQMTQGSTMLFCLDSSSVGNRSLSHSCAIHLLLRRFREPFHVFSRWVGQLGSFRLGRGENPWELRMKNPWISGEFSWLHPSMFDQLLGKTRQKNLRRNSKTKRFIRQVTTMIFPVEIHRPFFKGGMVKFFWGKNISQPSWNWLKNISCPTIVRQFLYWFIKTGHLTTRLAFEIDIRKVMTFILIFIELVVATQIFWEFSTRSLWKWSNWTSAYFSNGLVQPQKSVLLRNQNRIIPIFQVKQGAKKKQKTCMLPVGRTNDEWCGWRFSEGAWIWGSGKYQPQKFHMPQDPWGWYI